MAPAKLHPLEELQKREINFSLSTFFDQGWRAKLGDPMNGWNAQGTFDTLDDALDFLLQQAKKYYPENFE